MDTTRRTNTYTHRVDRTSSAATPTLSPITTLTTTTPHLRRNAYVEQGETDSIALNGIRDLPDPLMRHIFVHLDPQTRRSTSMVCAEWHRLCEGSQPLPPPESDTDGDPGFYSPANFTSNNEDDRATAPSSSHSSFTWSERSEWLHRANYAPEHSSRRYQNSFWHGNIDREGITGSTSDKLVGKKHRIHERERERDRERETDLTTTRPHKRAKLIDTVQHNRTQWESRQRPQSEGDEEEEEEEACLPDSQATHKKKMTHTASGKIVRKREVEDETGMEDERDDEGEREGEEECEPGHEEEVTAEDIEGSIKGLTQLLDPLSELQDKANKFEELLMQMREVRDLKDDFRPLIENVGESLRQLKRQIGERKSFFALLQVCAVPLKVHLGYFGLLPTELIYAIFTFVEGKELTFLSQVCTLFFGIAQEESLWKSRSETAWMTSIELGQKPENRNWKWLFKAKMHNFRPGEVRNGVGRSVLPYGNLYEGEWKDNLRHGQGTGIMKDGRRYDGQWENDMRSGFGIFRWPLDCGANGGDMYVGEWKRSKRHGKGIYTWVDGTRYDGQWGDGKREGMGCVMWPDGRKYVGEYKDGKMEGKGTFTWPDTSVYVGEYKNGKRHGKGKYIYAKGGQYDGEWEGGMRQGYGVLFKSTGEKYEGQWRYNAPWGLGVVTYSDGRRVEKYWTEEELLME